MLGVGHGGLLLRGSVVDGRRQCVVCKGMSSPGDEGQVCDEQKIPVGRGHVVRLQRKELLMKMRHGDGRLAWLGKSLGRGSQSGEKLEEFFKSSGELSEFWGLPLGDSNPSRFWVALVMAMMGASNASMFWVALVMAMMGASNASITVHLGHVSSVHNSSELIFSMSGDRSIWLPFLASPVHGEESFLMYMLGNSHSSYSDTRSTSFAEYSYVSKEDGVGEMDISIWIHGFQCHQANCNRLAPVVLSANGSAEAPQLYTLWEFKEGGGSPGSTIEFENAALHKALMLNGSLHKSQACPTTTGQASCSFQFRSITPPAADDDDVPFSKLKSVHLCQSNSDTDFIWLDITAVKNASERALCLRKAKLLNPNILFSFLSSVVQSFTIHHKLSLDSNRGSAADILVTAFAIPGTFIAVLATTRPLANYQFKLLTRAKVRPQKFRSGYFDISMIILICICNVLVAILSFLAAFAILPNELERQKRFTTWGLLAEQIPITNNGFRVLVFVHGESRYTSKVAVFVFSSGAVLLPLVACITWLRCRQLYRMRLIDKDASNEHYSVKAGQAVAMTTTEQMALEEKRKDLEDTAKGNRSAPKTTFERCKTL